MKGRVLAGTLYDIRMYMKKRAQKNRKVFVMMSGGVDSSVAAALLKKKGYDVTGAFIKGWSDNRFFKDKTMCPWVTDQEDARRVAAHIGIPFYTFDCEKEYQKSVVEYMVESYRAGITPNPDVMCNKVIKFGVFFEKARKLGADFVATGHYVRREPEFPMINDQFSKNEKQNENFGIENLLKIENCELKIAKDVAKDQSYFLWKLNQKQLKYSLFPIGGFLKSEVRELAREYGLPTAEKKDSQGLCFVGEVNVHDFLKSRIKPKKGKIITTSGKIIGEHEGAMFYTIGQRHGIGSPGGGTPYYVVGKDAKKNILYVGEGVNDAELYKRELMATQLNWILGKAPALPLRCFTRIRYRQPLQRCVVKRIRNQESGIRNNFMIHNSKFLIQFAKPQRAVTPGQSIVFYRDNAVIGGGVIV